MFIYFSHYIKCYSNVLMYVQFFCSKYCLYCHGDKTLKKERKKLPVQCDLLLAPPPSYYMRMSQNAADHVEHVQHADSEL